MAEDPVRDQILLDVVELVAGLQVPVSLGLPLGAATAPWTRLKERLQPFGWLDVDGASEYADRLAKMLGAD